MSIFRTRTGRERWTCFATGESGTAIDLVMLCHGCDVRSAIEWLARRTGVVASPELSSPSVSSIGEVSHRPTRPDVPNGRPRDSSERRLGAERAPGRVSARVEAYVETCESRLWRGVGAEALAWLTDERGLDEGVLRANRVGFDPGPDRTPRPRGLPALGPAVVFPVLDAGGKAIFYQARYLNPDATGRKYDNPPNWLASNPKLATIRHPQPDSTPTDVVIICEGIPDGLAAAGLGFQAISVLGTSNAGADVARHLVSNDATLVLAFDADQPGRYSSERLVAELTSLGRTDGVLELCLPPALNDLNAWILSDRKSARAVLADWNLWLPVTLSAVPTSTVEPNVVRPTNPPSGAARPRSRLPRGSVNSRGGWVTPTTGHAR